MVSGLECSEIGDLAAASGVAVHELVGEVASLEQAYLELTKESVEYRPDPPGGDAPATHHAEQEHS